MNETRKAKARILGLLLVFVMIISLWAGISPIEANAASSTHTHDGITFQAINSSNYTELSKPGSYYLEENIMISSRINITSGEVNLCLNGKTISTSSNYNDSLFLVGEDNQTFSNAILNIYDCKEGGTLTGGKGYSKGSRKGGAIYLRHSTLNMYGGTITGNGAVWGGAVFIDGSDYKSTFNMYGGTIEYNTAQSGGGGVEVENTNSVFNIFAGSIINNSVTEVNDNLHKGGGVHFAAGAVNICGTSRAVIIKDNTVDGKDNNLYLRSGKVISVSNPASISSNSSIGVSSEAGEKGNQSTIINNYGANNGRFFFLDGTNSASYVLEYQNDSLTMVKASSHKHSLTYISEKTATCTEEGTGAYYICLDCSGIYADEQGKTATTLEKLKIEKTEHEWEQGEVVAPSIDNVGVEHYTCGACDATKTENLYLNINDEKIRIEKADSLTYNGQEQIQKLNVYYDGTLLSEGTHYTISGNANVNAGNYTLTITGKGTFQGERTIDYEIKKAPLTVTVNNEEITYGDSVPAYSVTYSGFVNDETKDVLRGTLVFNCGYAQFSNAGNYDITATGYELDNYGITYIKGNVKVNKKVVGLDWSNLIFTYDGNAHLPTVTVTGLVNGDTCDVTVTGAGTEAGVYTATASELSNNNYMLPENATVEFVIQRPADVNEVTSKDKDVIEESLEIIEDLLSEENAGNLTEEERELLEEQKAVLRAKLYKIEAMEGRMEEVEDAISSLPGSDEVTSDNKMTIEETLDEIKDLLSGADTGNLTENEKKALQNQCDDLTEKLENINAAEEKMKTVENTTSSLPSADKVTSEDKISINDTLDIIEELLSEENVGNLTAKEKAKILEQKVALEEKLGNIEATEKKMETVENTASSLPSADEITSENKTAIEDALGIIEELLSEENAGNLTENEKKALQNQYDDLTEKLENIKATEQRLGMVENAVNNIPKTNEVTSDNKSEIERALGFITYLLSEENVGKLTTKEKAKIEEQKADLEEKLGNIKVAKEKMEKVEDTVTTLPNADAVTSDNKTAIEDALGIIENLLSEENVGNLTAEEKAKTEEHKTALEEKLGNIEAAEEKMEAVEDTVTTLPNADEVTSEDKTAIEDALGIIENLLSEENIGNLTAEEKAEIEDQKADLEEKLDVIQIVEDTLDVLQSEKGNIPSKDVITTESKDEVVKLLDIIKDLQENNPNNMTEEQKDVIECLREELQEKMERIQTIEDSLNEIENESASQPDYDDITSDNKEDIKDIIKNIENILKDEKENLSQEEKEALEEQKKELEDKVTFIEQLEKYEPVSGDFKNTTEPEINDLNADLDNDSNELIGIIPLEKTEKEHVAKSDDVKVYLEVSNITKTITEEAKELIETEVKDKKIAVYLDINLFKQIGEREPKKVPNTKGLVTITFKVPSNLVNTDNSVTRKYQVVRVHEGEVTIIDVVYDETTGMISFETDKFSTYAIVYKDQPIENDAGESGTNDKNDTSKDDVPKAGVISTTSIWLGTMALSGLGVLLVSKKKKED